VAYWIGVASRDHVRKGKDGGFCQLGHGKASAMRRLLQGDWIVYYSPRTQLKGGDVVQAFTALGRVEAAEPYTVDMGNGFNATRRDVAYLGASDAPIRPLIDRLSFIGDKKNWAYQFRFGVLKIPKADFAIIAAAMGVDAGLVE